MAAGGEVAIPAAVGSVSAVRAQRNSAKIGNGGRIKLTRDELLCTVATTANNVTSVFTKELKPSAGVMPFLFRLSSCYQRIRWISARITWRPSCGTNTNGIISYGVAFNNSKSVTTRDMVVALTPVNDHPVWQSSVNAPLIIPAEMLMSRKWYALNTTLADDFDLQIGKFCVGMTHDQEGASKSRGEFWINYTVEMEGTNPE